IYTYEGIKSIGDLCERDEIDLVIDGREHPTNPLKGLNVRKTGERPVFKLSTVEGYDVKLTDNHKVKTERGWVEAKDLEEGDKIHILNKKGGFGTIGNRDLGMILGWLIGDGTIKSDRAVLSFFGKEKKLAKSFAQMVNKVVDGGELAYARSSSILAEATDGMEKGDRSYLVAPIDIKGRDEVRVQSLRLLRIVKDMGLCENKHQVPEDVFQGCEQMQRGFLRALFSADGSFQGSLKKGGSIRLSQSDLTLLKQVQRLLTNFGIASKIYKDRRPAHKKLMPDGKGGQKKYECRAQHELVVSKSNLERFNDEIGFLLDEKQDRLRDYLDNMSRGPYNEYFKATFESLEEQGVEPVYDLTEPITHSFIANGFVVHNCGEQPLEDFEACNLGHINLDHCVKDGEVDWDKLEYLTDMGVRFLDNVVDASNFPDVVGYDGEEDAITKHVKENRKIGLGVMGWHHMLIRLGIPYDSKEAIQLAEKVMKFIQNKSKEVSSRIAEERGSFPSWDESKYEEPMRNATTTTIAPTGTTSMIADTSGGIEPIFAVSYVKNVLDGKKLVMPDSVFEEFAKQQDFYDEELMEKVAKKGKVTDIEDVPEEVKKVFITASEISPEWHIRMQGAFQKYVDNAISKTVNFANDATERDIKRVYDLAYDLKCKGITVYRDGSRQEQVMEVEGEKKDVKKGERRPRKRPHKVHGTTRKIPTGSGGLYITINRDEKGLFEVFAQIGRSGGFTQSFTESIARLVSLCLRSGIPVEEVVKQLEGIRSPDGNFQPGGRKIFSIPDAIAKALKWEMEGEPTGEQATLPTEEPENDMAEMMKKGYNPICPECGSMMQLMEGCRTCPNCGYSKC
ncbi:MAG: LAGLIDADG family homing endonuclease, partial [Thermoplasmata archaeon]